PGTLGHGRFGATLGLSYARSPLVEDVMSGDTLIESRQLIRNQLHASLGLSFGLWDRVTLHGTLPVSLVQTGDAPGAGSTLPQLASTALGDLRLGARVRLLGGLEGDPPARAGLGLDVSVVLPTGNPDA